jgi:hypothetical protein
MRSILKTPFHFYTAHEMPCGRLAHTTARTIQGLSAAAMRYFKQHTRIWNVGKKRK